MIDRRARFFLLGAVVALALVPAALPEHRTIAIGTAIVYGVIALLTIVETASRPRR